MQTFDQNPKPIYKEELKAVWLQVPVGWLGWQFVHTSLALWHGVTERCSWLQV